MAKNPRNEDEETQGPPPKKMRCEGFSDEWSWYRAVSKIEELHKAQKIPEASSGSLILSIVHSDLDSFQPLKKELPLIKGLQDVASYSWLRDDQPTIFVPGMPRLWKPLKDSPILEARNSVRYVRMDVKKYPRHPSEPSVQAILKTRTDFNTSNIEIITNDSILLELLNFVRLKNTPFKFDLQVIGKTVFLIEKDRLGRLSCGQIYGPSFRKAYSSWEPEVERSQAHKRIIKYQLAGLTCLVSFGVDAYQKEKLFSMGSGSQNHDGPSSRTGIVEAKVRKIIPPQGTSGGSREEGLRTKDAGVLVPQEAIVDFEIRSRDKLGHKRSAGLGRQWLTRVPTVIKAYQSQGRFTTMKKTSVKDEVNEWEKQNVQMLRKFGGLLKRIVDLAREHKDKRLEIRSAFGIHGSVLEVRRQADPDASALPEEVKKLWLQTPAQRQQN